MSSATHHAACPRTGLLARRAKPLEHAWLRIAREAVGPEGQVVPQVACTSARDVDPADRHRLDLVVYETTPLGEAMCCGVARVASDTREDRSPSRLLPLAMAPPSQSQNGASALSTLSCYGRGRSDCASSPVKLEAVGVPSAPAALRPAARQRQGWLRRSWSFLSVALQSTLAATLLGAPYVAGALPGAQHPPLADVLHDAAPPVPSLLGP